MNASSDPTDVARIDVDTNGVPMLEDLPRTVQVLRVTLLTEVVLAVICFTPLLWSSTLKLPGENTQVIFGSAGSSIGAMSVLFVWVAFMSLSITFLGMLANWARDLTTFLELVTVAVCVVFAFGGDPVALLPCAFAVGAFVLLLLPSTRDACVLKQNRIPKDLVSPYTVYTGYAPPPIGSPKPEQMTEVTVTGHNAAHGTHEFEEKRPSPPHVGPRSA